MKLIYLSDANLRDRLFIKDFVFNYKSQEKALVFHTPFGDSLRDTRFVTKRISSMLSEAMVYNNAFLSDQRAFFFYDEAGEMGINKGLIEQLLDPIQQLILGPVLLRNGEAELADSLRMLRVAQVAFEVETVTLFPANPMSPLGQTQPLIDSEAERDRLLAIYEEEREVIELAYELRPARISLPANYAQAPASA
jgi:hypothetical protein